MGISEQDITRVKESVDIVALISESVPLKRTGRRYSGCCPFHDEKTPSFSVNPEMGFFYCFGCHKKGDAITFLRESLHMDFTEAVEALAKRANITLTYDKSQVESKTKLTPLYDALKAASEYYAGLLKTSDEAKTVRQYLRSRGIEKTSVDEFQIGYSPDAYDGLVKHLSKDFTPTQLVEANLAYKNSRGQYSDVFRSRLMFPIKNVSGAVIGFGARTMNGAPPKYKNTSETKLYRKSNVLYNIDKAKGDAVAQGYFVVCEGYTDVIAFNAAGIKTAVATCGTAATLEHVKIMSKYAKKIILCFDYDSAGQKATERWLEFINETEADFYVAKFSVEKDPADIYLEDPKLLIEGIENAEPFMQFLLDRTVGGISPSASVEERANTAQRVALIIAKQKSQLIREGYVVQYSSKLGFEPKWFFEELAKIDKEKQNPVSKSGSHGGGSHLSEVFSRNELHTPSRFYDSSQPRNNPNDFDNFAHGDSTIEIDLVKEEMHLKYDDPRQRELLRLCVHEPGSVASFISGEIFSIGTYREIFDSLIEHETIDSALQSLNDFPRSILNQILVEDFANVEDISSYSLDVFSRVVIDQMRDFLHKLVANGDEESSKVKKYLDTLNVSIEKGDAEAITESAGELLAIRGSNARY